MLQIVLRATEGLFDQELYLHSGNTVEDFSIL